MLFTTPRLSASSRGQLLLAAIPLATMVITRALGQLEDLIVQRTAVLAGLDARIAAREAALGVLARYAPAEPAPSPPPAAEPPRCAAEHPVPGTDTCLRDPGHDGSHIGLAAAWWDTVDVTQVDPDAGPIALAGCHECGAPATTESKSGVPWCAEHVPARA